MTVLTENLLFSIYGISIEHPRDWKIFFDPKRAFDYTTGFFRIEDYVPRKGAQISLSINWEKVPSENEGFAQQYCENIRAQYKKQMKKTPFQVEAMDILDFLDGQAAYIVSEYRASPGLMKKKSDGPVRTMQLAYYDEASGRAVVSSVIGRPETISAQEDFLRGLLFSVRCGSPALLPHDAFHR